MMTPLRLLSRFTFPAATSLAVVCVFMGVLSVQFQSFADTGKSEIGNYDIRDFGAKGDGQTVNTKAIQAAIDACAASGGGTVVVPSGDFRTGTLQLKSYVTLQLSAAGRILGSTNRADYLNSDT